MCGKPSRRHWLARCCRRQCSSRLWTHCSNERTCFTLPRKRSATLTSKVQRRYFTMRIITIPGEIFCAECFTTGNFSKKTMSQMNRTAHSHAPHTGTNRTFFHTHEILLLMRTLKQLRKRKTVVWKCILASYTHLWTIHPKLSCISRLPCISNLSRCGSVDFFFVSVKMGSVTNNLWDESRYVNAVTTSGWSSYHAHLNDEFYYLLMFCLHFIRTWLHPLRGFCQYSCESRNAV